MLIHMLTNFDTNLLQTLDITDCRQRQIITRQICEKKKYRSTQKELTFYSLVYKVFVEVLLQFTM